MESDWHKGAGVIQLNDLEWLNEVSERIAKTKCVCRPEGQRFENLVDVNIVGITVAKRKELVRHLVKVLELRKNQLS